MSTSDDLLREADQQARRLAQPAPPASTNPPGQALSSGSVGTALLFIERARVGLDRWQRAHRHLLDATARPVSDHDTAGLYLGAPAIAFVLDAAAGPSARYREALAALDEVVARLAHRRSRRALERIKAGRLADFAEYDLFLGLTGLGALLLRRAPTSSATEHVLTYLVALTRTLTVDGDTLPGWWVGHDPQRGQAAAFRGGHANIGVAHGIAGPLALLSQAARRGLTVNGHLEAIATICAWLDSWQIDGPTGPFWPPHINLAELRSSHCARNQPGRPGWCYGTPGIARAGQLAALALGDPQRRHAYEQALLACLDDPAEQTLLTDPGLCHGHAGLYQTVRRAAADDPTGALSTRLPQLVGELLRATHAAPAQGPGHRGFLNGLAGTALALHTAAADTLPISGWDACLLIS
ncbi:lanthionine synthetase C family protein [Pseudofrankia sp. BMG5.36]|uniref:lanthionine synthetase C family protein n=1 Tax=Pseudofrankia sp. BMG5.36 TaxID=1834512 RepID=UPI0008D95D94|nr:lanthionine synthetase C family protein [Pseudofrankia sp. BMG5.36]OHV63665.1 lanthionine synthetase [Pseudofrankia sp. BMG5.36]